MAPGLRRVAWIRVTQGARGSRAEAFALGHRLPRVVPIPVSAAKRLAAQGVPVVVRHDRSS